MKCFYVSGKAIFYVRAGLSKCGARLEAFLRGPTQWLVRKLFKRASSHNHRNGELWWKSGVRKRQCQARGVWGITSGSLLQRRLSMFVPRTFP